MFTFPGRSNIFRNQLSYHVFAQLITLQNVICNISDGNEDADVNEPTTVSKRLFPAHVREMHRNRDEGFEREFEVKPYIHYLSSIYTCNHYNISLCKWTTTRDYIICNNVAELFRKLSACLPIYH